CVRRVVMAKGRQRKLEEALRAGVSNKKVDIDKLMASTTATLLNSNIVFTPSSVPLCNQSDTQNVKITILKPTHNAEPCTDQRNDSDETPKAHQSGKFRKVNKPKSKKSQSIGDKPIKKKAKRRRRRTHKKKAPGAAIR
uniref:Uncharacterized protein n=1 Tax=Parascaris univalens TaxID=6257 RepID=A0A915ACG8_PARUN